MQQGRDGQLDNLKTFECPYRERIAPGRLMVSVLVEVGMVRVVVSRVKGLAKVVKYILMF
jgi:hypothetical protein